MDHDDIVRGGPGLDRQDRPGRHGRDGRPLVPQRVPEPRPTPLQGVFIYLSVVVLGCGVVVIMALELGTPMSSPLVRLPGVVGGLLLVALTSDAIVRIWRSAFAWLPIDRGRGLARFAWAAVLVGALLATIGILWILLTA